MKGLTWWGGAAMLLFALWACSGVRRAPVTARPSLGLSVGEGGILLLEGRPYRGAGVNYFNAFIRTLDEGNFADTSYRNGFRYLQKRDIPFVRFAVNGYWPKSWGIYRHHPERFFENLDAFVDAAEEFGIGLIPSFFWHTPTLPDLVGEPVNQWGNPDSETSRLMRQFVREVVVRYRDSPAIWGWEQGNEVNLLVDLPGDDAHLPPTVPALGTPSIRSKADKLTTADLQVMMKEFAQEVRKHDPQRIVITGNAIPRPAAYHLWHERTWNHDAAAQFAEVLNTQSPDPIDVLSIHLYPNAADEGYFADDPADLDELIATSVATAEALGKPLFIGEFGAQDAKFGADGARQHYGALLESIARHEVPLVAMWVFDYPPHDQEEGINVSPDNGPREYMLEGIRALNERGH